MKRLIAALALAGVCMNAIPLQAMAGCSPGTGSVQHTWSRAACGPVCTVRYNGGGVISHFMDQVENMKRDRVTLRIDGPCASACTMAADKARPRVCITKRALLQFHNGYYCPRGDRFRPAGYYSRDILGWVDAHGGFPGADADDESVLEMNYGQARAFFKACA
ncbi:hypothetical protein [Methylobacterium indicum]|uniref:Lipoprotein n=1 Tax=Methylobacterium indicum TaxID=1775910 RepID=A0A8H9CAJ7_9HYPH|nr:hypothetical protein [Methylobacterium indicum]BCM87886.1 hypothetical protein mvi_63470 [Methylobacterium indicum]